jgi:hypothetical protein
MAVIGRVRSGRHDADDRLIQALLAGMTTEQAAAAVGISLRTISRRRAEPDFRARLTQARGLAMERATDVLASTALDAVRVVRDHLDAQYPASVRLGAAKMILDAARTWIQESEIDQRLDEVEAALQRAEGNHGQSRWPSS